MKEKLFLEHILTNTLFFACPNLINTKSYDDNNFQSKILVRE